MKRSKQGEQEDNGNENEKKEEKKEKKNPIIQNGLYVAEMFAAHVARLHVISFIVKNDIIYIWYFDRQNTIQCSGINFVQDLPRFMVLLFIMQRMKYKQWGLNPVFEPEPGFSGEIKVEDKNLKSTVDLQLDLKSPERMTHFGLRGRATTVFPVKSTVLSSLPRKPYFWNQTAELVAKLFWPEETRQSEPDILEEVYKIAIEEPDVLGHVPEMVWFYKFDETSTAIIRRALGFDDAELGHRVLFIMVFKKLFPITTLVEKEFLVAWWQVVKCHRALWRRGVHHRDVSPNNLMVYRLGNRFISVLNDFDLASIVQLLSSIKQRSKGFERTGTVPFMALKLLTRRAILGEVEHVYQHDAESFIWVLTWICLRYQGGKLLRKNRPLDEWLTVDAMGCHEKKTSFMAELLEKRPTRSHKENFNVAMRGLAVVIKYTSPFEIVPTDDEVVFQTWLQEHMPADALRDNVLPGQ
ncbi:hypothetical protein DEU56DRAFT_833995 [Suillus clintonianus]|uniref:uncharacterized protein n=1 Tax=Suillus clintonianus TaxID=1904413 RepID=UPI001B86F538|nr:uncharacterized protein DEU56DRAFT_833995 [Suillus clintonianus]KAG2121601.1 hypothetical protein DEU56DRAFT_833995 [Suillus clintonianus]